MRFSHPILAAALCCSTLSAAETADNWFSDGNVDGNVKYYYIDTDKKIPGGPDTSAHANTIGGQLSYTTGSLYGLKASVRFMTTNPFALPNAVDTSIIGRDNAVSNGEAPGSDTAQKGFSTLGEAYLSYGRDFYNFWYGRRVIETPLIHAKEVRLLPSSVRGGMASFTFENGLVLEAGHLDRFKQRTNERFYNIVEHALGTDTQTVIGHDKGYVLPVHLGWSTKGVKTDLYGYFAPDFMHSAYFGASYKKKLENGIGYCAAVQAIKQQSVGNADKNLDLNTSVSGGEKIDAGAVGLKLGVSYAQSKLSMAYTNVLRNSGKHDSLVLPWDGTPLFTNMITSNNLFQSNYGKALQADSAYIGGTQGVKLAYSQGFDFTGLEGFKTVLSYARFTNGRAGYNDDQTDYNAVLAYKWDDFSIALKGIWVHNNTSAAKDGSVSQIDALMQYRVIANYRF